MSWQTFNTAGPLYNANGDMNSERDRYTRHTTTRADGLNTENLPLPINPGGLGLDDDNSPLSYRYDPFGVWKRPPAVQTGPILPPGCQDFSLSSPAEAATAERKRIRKIRLDQIPDNVLHPTEPPEFELDHVFPMDQIEERRSSYSNGRELDRIRAEQEQRREEAEAEAEAEAYHQHDLTAGGERPERFVVQSHRIKKRLSQRLLESRRLDDYENRTKKAEKEKGVDPADVRVMGYARRSHSERRIESQKAAIKINVTAMENRKGFLQILSHSLLEFGAPSHRLEAQLNYAAEALAVTASFTHFPGFVILSYVCDETQTSQTYIVKRAGGLQLSSLAEVHRIYGDVVEDGLCAREGTQKLQTLLGQKPIYGDSLRSALSFFMSVFICPLAFGGSFLDAWLAGVGALAISIVRLRVSLIDPIFANVVEIVVVIMISFISRALNVNYPSLFCYSAISSAAVISMLPGYLILTSSLELGSKNMICGSVKMVYALIFTLFLGFGLEIGSDLWLLFDTKAYEAVLAATLRTTGTVHLMGSWVADNATQQVVPLRATVTFTDALPADLTNIVRGCLRPPSNPWYLRQAPFWFQFVAVPIFSVLCSLGNLQAFRTNQDKQNLIAMVFISCASYATNTVANHYVFGNSDIVSAIGAFTIGLLANLWTKFGKGSSFTVMVTGILFLVPSGLSEAGGFTTNVNSVDVGGSMIYVSIGITVGLFMSHAMTGIFFSKSLMAAFSF